MKKNFLKLITFVWILSGLVALYSCSNVDHNHTLTHNDAIAPTCTQVGNVEYWHCSDCGKNFSNEKANNEIDSVTLPSSHKLVLKEEVLPSCTENGALEHWLCTECHVKFSDSVATTVLPNVFLPGEHCFVNGICEKCSAQGTPGLIYDLVDEQYIVTGIEDSNVLRIVIPSSYNEIPVVAIADKAFQNCPELMSVEIGENIIEVGNEIFDGCDRLIEIVNNSDIIISDTPKSLMEIHTGGTKLKNINGYLFYVLGDTDSFLTGYVGEETELVLPENFVIDESIRVLLPRMVIAEDFENRFLIPIIEKFESLLEEYCLSSLPDTNFSFFDNENYIPYEFGCVNVHGVLTYLSDMRAIYRSVYNSASDEYKKIYSLNNDISKLIINYSLQNPRKYVDRDEDVLEVMYNEYPITRNGTAIYVYYGLDTKLYKEAVANIIKTHFSDYNYQTMYEQERACGYVHNTYSIDDLAFKGRNDLIGITFSNGVADMEIDALGECENLVNIKVEEGNTEFSSKDGNLYSADGKRLIRYAPGKKDENFTFPLTVESVARYAFKGHNLNVIIIPEGVTEIKDYAFSDMYTMFDRAVELRLPESLEKIGRSAFDGAYLAKVNLPNGLSEIGSYAFRNNYLEQIHLPESVTYIGIGAFSGNYLTSIKADEGNAVYHVMDNCLIHTSLKVLVLGTADSVIPNDGSVQIIGSEAFSNIYHLQTLHIPSSVLYIMSGAFMNSHNLQGLTYDGDSLFFMAVNHVPIVDTVILGFDAYYSSENETHRMMLLRNVRYTALHRSEDTAEYYYEFYRNYVETYG